MTEGAEYHAHLYAGLFASFGYGLIDGGYDLGRGESFFEMLQGGEADLGVNNMILLQLVEHIEGGYAQGFFCLHQVHLADGAFDVVGEIETAFGGDEFVLVDLRSDGRIELMDGFEAEGAIQVEMEFDFWPGLDPVGGGGRGCKEHGAEDEENITHSGYKFGSKLGCCKSKIGTFVPIGYL